MTRTAHHSHPTPAFPVYTADWVADDKLILGGGGGASRSGIKNKLVSTVQVPFDSCYAAKLCSVSPDGRSLTSSTEFTFKADEDAPMTIALNPATKQLVTGVNTSMESVKAGKNEHVRVLSYDDEKFNYIKGKQTITADWSDDYPYQKLTAFNPAGTLLALGSTDEIVTVLSFPDLDHLFEVNVGKGDTVGELVDVSFSGDGRWLAVTSTTEIRIFTVLEGEKAKFELKQTIPSPTFDATTLIYRAARFANTLPPSTSTLYTVLNAARAPKRNAPRKAYIAAVDFKSEHPKDETLKEEIKKLAVPGTDGTWSIGTKREISGKPVTVFDVSTDGRMLAYGSSDLSIGILDSKTLSPQLKILHSHSFPPTALKFNPSGTLLVSASADNTVRLIVVPASFGGVSLALIAFLVALVALIVAVMLQRSGFQL